MIVRGYVRQLDMSGKVRLRSTNTEDGTIVFEGECNKGVTRVLAAAMRQSAAVEVTVRERDRRVVNAMLAG